MDGVFGSQTQGAIEQTLDMTNCKVFEDGGHIVSARTETSDLDVDFDGSSSTGSLSFTSSDGDREGTIDTIEGSGVDVNTTFSGDLSDDSGTFWVVAPCK